MIAEFKAYLVMKDSQVKWIGDVPTHWPVLPSRAIFEEVKERNRPEEPMLSVTIKNGVIRQDDLLEDSSRKDTSNLDRSAYKMVRPGDVAYNKMRAWQGAVGVSDYQGIVSPAYVVERPREGVSSRYFHYLLRTPAFAKEAERWSYGIASDMWSLRPEHFKMINACLPPLTEQIAIVTLLDHADRRIHRYIRAKRRLTVLLEEQKQAIIHQAVTGQIDVRTGQPYQTFKPSGAAWLGEVPAHWQVLPMKRAFVSMDYGISDTGTGDGTIAVLTMGDVRDGTVTVPEHGGVTFVAPNMLLQDKDLLFNRTNSAELVGKVGLFRSGRRPVTFASYLVRMRARLENRPEYLNLLLNDVGFVAAARREAIPSLHQSNLNPTRYGRLRIPLPPGPEQTEIIEFVMEKVSSIEAAVVKANREAELLHEYRIRLIADVVTGKLDVREVAAALPEFDPLEAEQDLEDTLGMDSESDVNDLDTSVEGVDA